MLKGGCETIIEYNTNVDFNRKLLENATEYLGKRPEIYSLARLHHDQEFDDIFKGMKQLQDEGLFGAFGASELKRETLERANKVSVYVLSSLSV